MVYGKDVVQNADMLSRLGNRLDFIEIVLFHTPNLHNIPSSEELQLLKEIRDRSHATYTVHLPASLEIASESRQKREESIALLIDIWLKTSILQPQYYILHIPITPPTLVAVPGHYFKAGSTLAWHSWAVRAVESLRRIRENVGEMGALLVENINFSPTFLEPFFEADFGGFCLDIGHLLLGDERVLEVLECFIDRIREIHLHGVRDHTEHISLDVLPRDRVAEWLSFLYRRNYQGLINLEVFSPRDLDTSLAVISDITNELRTRESCPARQKSTDPLMLPD